MKKQLPSSKLFITPFYFLSMLILLLFPGSLLAVTVKSIDMLDATGSTFVSEEDIRKFVQTDPAHYTRVVEKEFLVGNLASIGQIVEALYEEQPSNLDIKSVYVISLASKGQLGQARQVLGEISTKKDNPASILAANAMVLHKEGKLPEAVKSSQKAVSQAPKHPYYRNVLGRIQFDLEQYGEAANNFQKAVQLEPRFLPGYINAGAAAHTLGKYGEAIGYFRGAVKVDPRSFDAHLNLATVYEAMGDLPASLAELQVCNDINPGVPYVLEQIASRQIALGKYEEAGTTAEGLMEENPEIANKLLAVSGLHRSEYTLAKKHIDSLSNDNREKPYLLGYHALLTGDYDKALTLMQGACEKDRNDFGPCSAQTVLSLYLGEAVDLEKDLENRWGAGVEKLLFFLKAGVLGNQGEGAAALSALKDTTGLINGFFLDGLNDETIKAALEDPAFAQISMGVFLFSGEYTAQALEQFQQAVAKTPQSPIGHHLVGQCLLKLGQRDEAISSFNRSLEGASNFFSSLYILGELYFKKGKTEEAANYYAKALDVRKDTGLLIKLGLYHEYKGDTEQASAMYGEAIKLSPNNFIPYNQLAWLYTKNGIKLDTALELATKADKLQPGNGGILDTLGWIHYLKDDYKGAEPYLQQAAKISGNNPVVLYHLGAVQHQLGQQDNAKKHLEQALQISKDFEGAEEARKLLQQI